MPKISDEKKQANMLEIQKNAKALFIKNGFKTVTVDDICKQTGISKGSFYTYFESKESLFLEIAKNSNNSKQTFIDRVKSQTQDFQSVTLMLWDMIFSDISDDDIVNYRLTLEFWLESFENKDLRMILESKSKASLDVFKEMTHSTINSSVDEESLNTWALFFWSQAEGLMLYFTAHQRVPSNVEIQEIRKIVRHFADYMASR